MGKIKVKTQDEQIIEVDKEIACKSDLLKNFIEDIGDDSVIHLNNVSSKAFNKVMDFFSTDKEEYFSDVKDDRDYLFELILAANYLSVESLLDECCRKVADMIKDKPVEEIKQILEME